MQTIYDTITTVTASRTARPGSPNLRIDLTYADGVTITTPSLGMLEGDCPRGLGMSHHSLPANIIVELCNAIADAPTANEWTVTL